MRRLVLAFALFTAAPVHAAGDPGPTETRPVEDVSRPHEILADRPSGFWTSNRPSVGGAYKYRLLEIGCAISLLTGWLTWRLIKNAKGPREIPTPPPPRTTP
ncbi:MAG: hypothetical protein ABI467_24885 [Kofleriaceae bacterium]